MLNVSHKNIHVFLNLGYLFRFACLFGEADRIEGYMEDSMRKAEMLQSPRCIKSHLPLQLLPVQLWTVKPKAKYHIFTKSHDKRERTIKTAVLGDVT
jgi:hypothetical protein